MDLKQKYIEETKPYELDEEFLDQLREIPITHSVPIAVLIDVNAERLPELDGWTQAAGAVVRGNPSTFYEVEYLKEINEKPFYIAITETDTHTYLDHILTNTIFKEDDIYNRIKYS